MKEVLWQADLFDTTGWVSRAVIAASSEEEAAMAAVKRWQMEGHCFTVSLYVKRLQYYKGVYCGKGKPEAHGRVFSPATLRLRGDGVSQSLPKAGPKSPTVGSPRLSHSTRRSSATKSKT